MAGDRSSNAERFPFIFIQINRTLLGMAGMTRKRLYLFLASCVLVASDLQFFHHGMFGETHQTVSKMTDIEVATLAGHGTKRALDSLSALVPAKASAASYFCTAECAAAGLDAGVAASGSYDNGACLTHRQESLSDGDRGQHVSVLVEALSCVPDQVHFLTELREETNMLVLRAAVHARATVPLLERKSNVSTTRGLLNHLHKAGWTVVHTQLWASEPMARITRELLLRSTPNMAELQLDWFFPLGSDARLLDVVAIRTDRQPSCLDRFENVASLLRTSIMRDLAVHALPMPAQRSQLMELFDCTLGFIRDIAANLGKPSPAHLTPSHTHPLQTNRPRKSWCDGKNAR